MEEYGQTNSHGGKAIYVIAYFLILAAFMAPAQSLHMGEAAIFYAMVVAGAVLVGIVLGVKLIKRRIEASRLSGRGFTQLMFGITPDLVEGSVEYPDTDALPAASREMVVVGESYDDILPDTIIEENPLRLSDYFQPNIHTILGAMIAICGVRRSGKSNLIAVLAEELGRFSVPMVIFDTEDEYGTLVDRRFLPRSLQVGSEAGLADSNSAAQYRVLSADDAYEFGQSILEGRLQVVVNLRSWQDEDAAVIMSEIIDGMNDWEQSKRNEERIPVMVFLDEAQKWLPQNVGDKYVSSETQTMLHHAFFDTIVARGGKRGFGLIIGFQRYSQINKNVLQSQWKFLFRQTETIDVKKYEALGIEQDDTNSLMQGQCFVFGPTIMGFKAMMRKRMSKHNADTPGLSNLMRNQSAVPVDAFIEKKYTQYAPKERMEDLPMRGTPSPRKKEQELIDRGINAYQEGATSIDKLAAALGITRDGARQLKPKIEVAMKSMEAEVE